MALIEQHTPPVTGGPIRRRWNRFRGYVQTTNTIGKDLAVPPPFEGPTGRYFYPRAIAHLRHVAAGLTIPLLVAYFSAGVWWWHGCAAVAIGWCLLLLWNRVQLARWTVSGWQLLRLSIGLAVPAYHLTPVAGWVALGAWVVAYVATLARSD